MDVLYVVVVVWTVAESCFDCLYFQSLDMMVVVGCYR